MRWQIPLAVAVLTGCTNNYGSFYYGDGGAAGGEPGDSSASTGGSPSDDASIGSGGTTGSGGSDSGGAPGSGGSGGASDASTGGVAGQDGSLTDGAAGGDGTAGSDASGDGGDASMAGDASAAPDGSGDADAASPGDASTADAGDVCASRYGTASGYVLCSEDATSCRFAVTTNGSNCQSVCVGLGGTCLDADDNGAEVCVATNLDDDCTTARTTTICTCTKS